MKKNKMIFTVFFAFMSIGLYAAKVRILKVESIKGLKKVYCSHTDCSQEVTATLSYGADLPTGATIAWEGDATFEKAEGLKVTANFSKHMGKDKKISVKEGKQTALESSKYDVIDNTPILSVSINFPTPKTVTPPSLGIFGPFPMEADISVFFEHTNHKWATVLTKATVKSVLGASIKGFTEANVSSCTSKKIYEQMCIDLFL